MDAKSYGPDIYIDIDPIYIDIDLIYIDIDLIIRKYRDMTLSHIAQP